MHTTLAAGLQRDANAALDQAAAAGLDAALVAVDPATGEVRAMANGGSARRAAFNVALDGRRQPGSAFKPFMLAAAFEGGLAPDARVESAPFSKRYGATTFRVTNGGGYTGRTTLERATWLSDNSVYARLQDRFGIESAIRIARAAGIRSAIDPVPAAVLGALPEGTTPTELAHAYATFAAHGSRTSLVDGGGPRMLARVDGEGDDAPWRPISRRSQPIPREIADLVTSVLRGVIARGTGTAAGIGRPAAGKTGTTEDYKDAWFVGYTPTLVVAVWVGHASGGIPMRTENGGGPVTGGSIPARIWHDFMQRAVAGRPVARFELDEPDYVTVTVDPGNGLLAGPWCIGSERVRLVAGHEPTRQSATCEARTRVAPDVVGLSEDAARALLDEQDFTSGRAEDQLVTDPADDGLVVAQDPPAGAPVQRDDAIHLVVGDAL